MAYSKVIIECKWSKDPLKKYKQCGHLLNNHKKYNLNISDMIYLQSIRNDLYKIINKK